MYGYKKRKIFLITINTGLIPIKKTFKETTNLNYLLVFIFDEINIGNA